MKKINYFYFFFLTAMWLAEDRLLNILSHHCPGWLVLLFLFLYVGWYILSAPLFYILRKRAGVKKTFMTCCRMEAQWSTFWVDAANHELAYLCLFNPFRIHYLPLDSIDHAQTEVHYARNNAYIDHVNCSFYVNQKRNTIRVDTSTRGYLLKPETTGRTVIDQAQRFVNLLNRKQEAEEAD